MNKVVLGVFVIIGLSIIVEGICGNNKPDNLHEYLKNELDRIDRELHTAEFFHYEDKVDRLMKEKADVLDRLSILVK